VATKRRTAPAGGARSTVAAARGRGTPTRSTGGAVWDNLKSLLGVIALFLLIRIFLVEAYRIPSGSMVPSLLVGDWLFVNKLVYGPHIPFTDINLPGYADPRPGEVVVFESPYQPDEAALGNDATPTLVKRLVGMPGDTLHMRAGLLHVNGAPQPQPFAAENPIGNPNEVSELFAWQNRHALATSRFGGAPAQPTHDDWGPLVVPARYYFMLGDSRYQSKDSRYWGLVPRDNLRGRPLFVYYSWDAERGRFLGPLVDIRWSRIGHWIR
jgi:signal peptidase I